MEKLEILLENHRDIVMEFVDNLYNEKYPKSKNKKAGRPKKTTKEMDNFIVDNVERNRKLLPNPKSENLKLVTFCVTNLNLVEISTK